jgi:protocatechuate 3,4-dioxygenase beta subunit
MDNTTTGQRAIRRAVMEVLELRQLLSGTTGDLDLIPEWQEAGDNIVVNTAISGTVRNSQGQPLAGLNVQLFQSMDPDSADEDAWWHIDSTTTNAQGVYQFSSLESRHYRVNIGDGEVASNGKHYLGANLYDVVAFDGATTSDMNFTLREAGKLTGRVYDSSNQPLSGVTVLMEGSWADSDDTTWHTAVTNSKGVYDLYLPVTDQRIYPLKVVEAPVAGVANRWYAVQIAPGLYSATASGSTGYDFHLSLGGRIIGTFVNENGEPIANREVIEGVTHIANGMFEDPNAWTDDNGLFSLPGVPANTDIYLSTIDWDWDEIEGEAIAIGERVLGPYRVAAGQTLNIGTFTIRFAGSLQGVITDNAGNPIVGAEVQVIGVDIDGGSVWYEDDDAAVSDALGQYRLPAIPPGYYMLRVSKEGWLNTVVRDIAILSGETHQRDIRLQPATGGVSVSGSVSNYSAVAVKNAQGQLLPARLMEYDEYDYGSGMGILSFPQGIAWTPQELLLPELAFSAEEGVDDGFGDYFEFDANRAGRFELDIPAGPQSLVLYRDVATGIGTWQVILSNPYLIDAAPGSSIDNLALAAPTGTASLQGALTLPPNYRIVSVDGASEIKIYLKDLSGASGTFGRSLTSVAPDGRYRFAGLPAGSYSAYIVGPGLQPLTSGTITLAAGQAVTLNFTVGYGATVTGTVSSDGVPIPGAIVRSSTTGYVTLTDADGGYRLSGLLAGSDTITVTRAGFTGAQQTLALTTGAQGTANFTLLGASASITGGVIAPDTLTDGRDNDGDDLIDEDDEQYPTGVAVVAYNKDLAKSYITYTTAGGLYDFNGLAPGSYRIIATGTGFASAMYPLADSADLLIGQDAVELTDEGDLIVLALARPEFTVTSTCSSTTLSVTLRSNMPLLAMPQITVAQGAGSVGNLTAVNATTLTFDYTLGAGDTAVRLLVSEDPDQPVVGGHPASRTFGFDVSSQLRQLNSTNFFNAQGASLNIMGTQDTASVYLPPMALSTDNSGLTQATTLTVVRYGEPGQNLGGSMTSISSRYEFVIGDGGGIEGVTLAHRAVLTLSFRLPAGVTQAQFRSSLRVGFYSNAASAWVWNNLADSNPSSGIRNIQINWVSSTITFEASHFTQFTLAVVPNKAPTGLSLSQTTALQGWPKGTRVATLTATDPNVGDTFTFSLVSGSGSTHNSMFRVVGNQLRTNAALYYGKTYKIRLQVKDQKGLKYQKAVSIRVTGKNAAPTSLAISPARVQENRGIGTTVGTFSTRDPNSGDSFTYSLVSGTGSTHNSKFSISGNQLRTASVFNYEARNSYSIRVMVKDRGGKYYAKAFTIAISNANEAPTGVTLSSTTVSSEAPAGALVATLTGRDPDSGALLTLSLPETSPDNEYFQIVGNQLRTSELFDGMEESYSILIRVKDQGNLLCDVPITITVV